MDETKREVLTFLRYMGTLASGGLLTATVRAQQIVSAFEGEGALRVLLATTPVPGGDRSAIVQLGAAIVATLAFVVSVLAGISLYARLLFRAFDEGPPRRAFDPRLHLLLVLIPFIFGIYHLGQSYGVLPNFMIFVTKVAQ